MNAQTVTLPVSLSVENLLQVIATLSEKIRMLESGGACCAGVQAVAEVVPPEIMTVLAAAVHATYGARARIIRMSEEHDVSAWSTEGRRQIFLSHAVR